MLKRGRSHGVRKRANRKGNHVRLTKVTFVCRAKACKILMLRIVQFGNRLRPSTGFASYCTNCHVHALLPTCPVTNIPTVTCMNGPLYTCTTLPAPTFTIFHHQEIFEQLNLDERITLCTCIYIIKSRIQCGVCLPVCNFRGIRNGRS